MSTSQTPGTAQRRSVTPKELGIGMRFSLHPHCDDFVEVILGALHDAEAAGLSEGLLIETDAVSTYVGAVTDRAEQRLVDYLGAVISAASRRSNGGHLVAQVLLSRGCPGEVTCDLTATGLPAPNRVEVEPTGVRAVAQWSLYPLLDAHPDSGTGGGTGGDTGGHMAHIEAAITDAQQRGTAATAAHYATRLDGDLAEVLATATDAWARVGTEVPHVVTHLTISTGSPSMTRDSERMPGS